MINKMVYLAGPMTGIENHNKMLFDSVAEELRCKGWGVINPSDFDKVFHRIHSSDRELSMAMSLEQCVIPMCDAICMLYGWENSAGAKKELAVAMASDIKIMVYPKIERGDE